MSWTTSKWSRSCLHLCRNTAKLKITCPLLLGPLQTTHLARLTTSAVACVQHHVKYDCLATDLTSASLLVRGAAVSMSLRYVTTAYFDATRPLETTSQTRCKHTPDSYCRLNTTLTGCQTELLSDAEAD